MQLALLLTALVACNGNNGDEPGGGDTPKFEVVESLNLSESDLRVATTANDAAIALLGEAAKRSGEDNMMVSPLSLTSLMGMVANGAVGETQREMLAALWQGATMDEVNALYTKHTADIAHLDGEVVMQMANSVWAGKDYRLDESYCKRMGETYHAELFDGISFVEPSATDAISQWVSGATYGKIPEFGKGLFTEPENVRALLLNALYFNGKWSSPFKKSATSTDRFTDVHGQMQNVPMMHNTTFYLYGHDADGTEVVWLPYGKAGKYFMQVVLPGTTTSIDSYVESLDGAALRHLDTGLTSKKVALSMPRFSMHYKTDLIPALQAMGISKAFDAEQADFSGMNKSGDKLYLSVVKQEAVIDVTEDGTEAAVATGGIFASTSVEPDLITLTINRPFLFLLRERESGAIILAGKVGRI